MNTVVTRDLVTDLWPLYRSGEASRDTRQLVDAFLAEDADFAATLSASEKLLGATPTLRLSPDAERVLLDSARQRARNKWLVIGGGVALAGIILMTALIGALVIARNGLGAG